MNLFLEQASLDHILAGFICFFGKRHDYPFFNLLDKYFQRFSALLRGKHGTPLLRAFLDVYLGVRVDRKEIRQRGNNSANNPSKVAIIVRNSIV